MMNLNQGKYYGILEGRIYVAFCDTYQFPLQIVKILVLKW